MLKKNLTRVLAVAMSINIATMAFAEDLAAPVYDADNYPPVFDDQAVDTGVSGVSSYSSGNSSSTRSMSYDQRLSRVEQFVNNLQHANLQNKIDALLRDIQSLRGQVEQLNHQLQQVQNQHSNSPVSVEAESSGIKSNEFKSLQAQVDQLSQQLVDLQNSQRSQAQKPVGVLQPIAAIPDDTIPVAFKSKKTKEPVTDQAATSIKTNSDDHAPVAKKDRQPNIAEEQHIYQTAYDFIKAKKYNEAIAALQKMLQKYPSGQFAANAHYWLGELFGLIGKNDQSAAEFGSVVTYYPDSPKVSDAQLKLGLIFAAQFKWSEAKSAFKKVINRYPGTASARLASEQIKQIRAAGH